MEIDTLDENTPDREIETSESMDIDEVLSKLTDLEKEFCRILITQNPKSKVEALKRAGSKASDKNLSKLAYAMEQRPHVQAYKEYLKRAVVEELGLSLQEVVANARKGIELAFALNKPKDADPHNRLLAELGGYIKNTSPSAQGAQVAVKVENNLKGETLDQDIRRLKDIIGN